MSLIQSPGSVNDRKRSRDEDLIEEFDQVLKKVKMDFNANGSGSKRKFSSDDDNPSTKKQKLDYDLDAAIEVILRDNSSTPSVSRNVTQPEFCQFLGLERNVDDNLLPYEIADEILRDIPDEVLLNLNENDFDVDLVMDSSDDAVVFSDSSDDPTIDNDDQTAQDLADAMQFISEFLMDNISALTANLGDFTQPELDQILGLDYSRSDEDVNYVTEVKDVARLIIDDIMTMDETKFNQLLEKEGVTFNRNEEIQTRKVRDDEQKKFTTVDAEEEKWYDVDKIKKRRLLQSKQRKKKPINADYEYLVSWLGYSSKYDSWEPYENVAHLKKDINVRWR